MCVHEYNIKYDLLNKTLLGDIIRRGTQNIYFIKKIDTRLLGIYTLLFSLNSSTTSYGNLNKFVSTVATAIHKIISRIRLIENGYAGHGLLISKRMSSSVCHESDVLVFYSLHT